MVSAYYSRLSDVEGIFRGLMIEKAESFQSYAGKYDVIHLNMQDFLSSTTTGDEMLSLLQRSVLWDLLKEYPDFEYFDKTNLMRTMSDVYQNTKRRFVIVIDEWDCIFREYREHQDWQNQYLDFLRAWLKDKSYVGLAYMTGILPIKKYGTHSALNMFSEFSMTDAGPLAEFVGSLSRRSGNCVTLTRWTLRNARLGMTAIGSTRSAPSTVHVPLSRA